MALHYHLGDDTADELITNLVELAGGSPDADQVKELIVTALKLVEDHAARGDLKIVNNALKELRYAFRIFAPYRHVRKVTIFGSARTKPDAPAARAAEALAAELARRGFMVITGAGDGIMGAAQRGAGRERSFGVNIRLPFEQKANATIDRDPKLINFKYFFTRKLVFVKETSAVALFPGGFGTHDEGFELLTLLQTGKTVPVPVVYVDEPGGTYWKAWRQYIQEHLLRRALISEEDINLFRVVDDPKAAADEISTFYRNYHSSRFVRDQYVIRLLSEPTDDQLAALTAEFRDITVAGEVRRSPALPEEAREEETRHLPRIAFKFNRMNYGRLRLLIDRINSWAPAGRTAEAPPAPWEGAPPPAEGTLLERREGEDRREKGTT